LTTVGSTKQKDEELIKAVLSGEERAFTILIERYFGMVFMIAYSRLFQRENAEDLAQEVFLRAYLALKDLRQPQFFPAWISRITRNLAADWQRKGQRTSRLITMVPLNEEVYKIPDTEATDRKEKMEAEERDNIVNATIMKLPVDLRELVLLHYVEGLNIKEIARQLGIHPAAARRQLQKALSRMHGQLEPILYESAPAFKVPKKAVARSIAILTSAAAMSASTKSAIAATAGSIEKSAAVLLTETSGMVTSGGIIGFLKTIPASIAAGGMIMGVKQGVAITVTAIVVLGGAYYLHESGGGDDKTIAKHESTEIKPKTIEEEKVLAILGQIKSDFENENYNRLGKYGKNSFLSWSNPDKLKEYLQKELNDDQIDGPDYVFKSEPTEIYSSSDKIIVVLTESWHGTSCNLEFVKKGSGWIVNDINNMQGFGRYIKLPDDEQVPPSHNTNSMSKNEIVQAFYQALIQGDADIAVGYLASTDTKTAFQLRNMLQKLFMSTITSIEDIREIKNSGENVFVRFGVSHGFPGGGLARRPDERQGIIRFVDTPNGLKINPNSGFIGDQRRAYQ
jgi:RNA polymerase sigma-70 factor, ECF subfamily